MSLSTLLSPLFALAAVWVFIHLALRIFLPHASRVPLSYQPPPFSASRILLTERELFICFRTTRVNTYADRLEAWLTRRGRKHVARAVYALGGTLAAGGLLAAVAVLGWTVTKMASEVIRRWASASTAEGLADDVIRVWKREDPEVLAAVPAVQQAGYGIPVYAIVSLSLPSLCAMSLLRVTPPMRAVPWAVQLLVSPLRTQFEVAQHCCLPPSVPGMLYMNRVPHLAC